MGSHRSRTHGTLGMSKGAIEYRNERDTKLKGENNAATKAEITVTKTRGKYKKRTPKTITIDAVADATPQQGINQAEANALVTLGRLTQLCEDAARFYGTPAREFTQRCAALFYASQVR
jgi:hypothetical protein